MIINWIRRWLHRRRSRKLWDKRPEEWRRDVVKLFPGDSPFMDLMKRLNTSGVIVPDPKFKYFGRNEEQAQLPKWKATDLLEENLNFIKKWWRRIRRYRKTLVIGEVRGTKLPGARPTLIIVDDPEEESSNKSKEN